ncbi:hypothetical protein SAMN05421837_106564 [Amycolatopsis pretoriensis]|uniref:Uncharacterized protein n=1 Tax=Amycolatopsis pretoriensis TaxID=218821 RepID=A0A1H5R3P9_9PSEU|nr:hypothetical protein [Amycolatopsis pretoriensis]SEF33020.1 hypothetical protein SAMN05421837_106564 [Amycolatopsis pretoriensis]
MDDDNLLDSHPDLMDPEWRKHARTDAWLGAKQDRKQFRRQQKRRVRKPRRRWWIFGVFVAILAVTTAAIVLVGRRPAPAAAPPNPTGVPQYARVDLARPYANTPADTWRKGLDGITETPAGSAEADAYAQVKRAISAARLDPAVLTGHDPKAFFALVAPDMRDQLTEVFGRKPAKGVASFDSYVTEIADGYHLLDAGPRTFGTLAAHPGAKPGELAVDAKYVVAYAFDNVHPEGLTSPGEIVSFLRVDETYIIRSGKTFAESSHGLWLGTGQSAFSSVGCAAAKDGYLAPGYANPPAGPGTGEDQDAPGYYDPKYPVPALDGCPA